MSIIRKTVATVLALTLCLTAAGGCLAEEDKSSASFMDWLMEGVGMLEEEVSTWGESIEKNWDSWMENLENWSDEIGTYFSGLGEKWSTKAQTAWDTLVKKASERRSGGKQTDQETQDAYADLQAWLSETGETLDENMAAWIDAVAGAAGIAEARLRTCYRTVDAYLREHGDEMTDAVASAWKTVRTYMEKAGSVAGQQLRAAYETVMAWLEKQGIEEDGVTEALQEMNGLTPAE